MLILGIALPVFAGPFRGMFGGRGARGQSDDGEGRANRAPITLPAGARLEANVAYGSDPQQKFDVYVPANAKNAPVLFMVHGGAWRIGDKTSNRVVQNKIDHYLPKGYVFISTNYRMNDRMTPLAEADDVAAAVAYAQQHAASWGGDPSRFVLMGHSAGAHLVTLLSAVPQIDQRAGVKPWLGTVALDSAAYNVVKIMDQRHLGFYDDVFGSNRQLWEAASPTLQLKAAPPPMLLVCSSLRANSCDQATAFADKAKGFGGHVDVLPVAMRHAEINIEAGAPGQLTDRIDAFLRSLGLN
ncbi:MAG: alpha/beta hydrolase [Lysobacterales bacterium]